MLTNLQIGLRKQPTKYINKVDKPTYNKLYKALDDLKEWKGNIVKLKGTNYYRLKEVSIIMDINERIANTPEVTPNKEDLQSVKQIEARRDNSKIPLEEVERDNTEERTKAV